ncbi:hypothetical protein [Flavilitoribacter nigricans]|nr:hypothetical protein [Flavilitoribacter nigricans]
MLEVFAEYGSVIATSTLRLFLGAGLSLAYGHHPLELWLLTSTGSVLGVFLCLLLGNKIRSVWVRQMQKRNRTSITDAPPPPALVKKIWQRYGLWGLAGASIFLGTIPSVAIALVSGLEKRRIFLYLTGGKIAWSTLIAIIGELPF